MQVAVLLPMFGCVCVLPLFLLVIWEKTSKNFRCLTFKNIKMPEPQPLSFRHIVSDTWRLTFYELIKMPGRFEVPQARHPLSHTEKKILILINTQTMTLKDQWGQEYGTCPVENVWKNTCKKILQSYEISDKMRQVPYFFLAVHRIPGIMRVWDKKSG